MSAASLLASVGLAMGAAGCGGAPTPPANDQTTVTVSPPSSAPADSAAAAPAAAPTAK